MSEKIIIASDSTTDLSKELIERYNISVLPLSVTLGTESFLDGVTVDAEKIYDFVDRTGTLPKTAAINVGDFMDYFEEITKDGSSVVFFSLGSKFSSSYNNACIAAQDFENVYIVDTENLSTGGGLLVLCACDMLKEGLSAKEIAEKSRENAKCVEASFVIDGLEYLYKGGRCSAVSVFGANLLKIKPCIEVKDGAMGVGKKYRGNFATVTKEYIKERLINSQDIDTKRVFVTHSGVDPEIEKDTAELVKSMNIFDEVIVTRAGCTVSSHCGPNTLGVLFVRKSPILK